MYRCFFPHFSQICEELNEVEKSSTDGGKKKIKGIMAFRITWLQDSSQNTDAFCMYRGPCLLRPPIQSQI